MSVTSVTIVAKVRGQLGSRANKRLRDTGFIPGVIYGHKEAVVPLTLPKRELQSHLSGGAHVLDLDIEGKNQKVLIKEVQYDHLGIEILHVDFARVSLDEKVRVSIPLELKGEPKGTEEGGVLQQIIASLEVECLVTDIPANIRHNVSEMKLDDVLHIRDIALPPGVRVLQDGELIVATVKEVLEVVAEVPAEAGAVEPEVIGRKPEEGEVAEEGAPAAEGQAKKPAAEAQAKKSGAKEKEA